MHGDTLQLLARLERDVGRLLERDRAHPHTEQLVKDASQLQSNALELEKRFTQLYRELQTHPLTLWTRLHDAEKTIERQAGEIGQLRSDILELRGVLKTLHADVAEVKLLQPSSEPQPAAPSSPEPES